MNTPLRVDRLEDRTTPVIGGATNAPLVALGTGYDGVVQVQVGNNAGTGSLLPDGYHILTAAHVVTDSSAPLTPLAATIIFELPTCRPGRTGRSRSAFRPPTLPSTRSTRRRAQTAHPPRTTTWPSSPCR